MLKHQMTFREVHSPKEELLPGHWGLLIGDKNILGLLRAQTESISYSLAATISPGPIPNKKSAFFSVTTLGGLWTKSRQPQEKPNSQETPLGIRQRT